MKRTEQMFRKVTMKWLLSALYRPGEDKAKLRHEFLSWVGIKFALRKQHNVGMSKKVKE